MASLATRPVPAPDGTTAATTGSLTARTADAYQDRLGQVTRDVAERLRTVRAPSVGPDRRRLERLVEGVDLDGPGVGDAAALTEADSLYAGNAVWFHHPSYLAHLNCPVVAPAVAAEAMLAAINTSVDTYDQSLVATLMERRLVRWTAERIGFTQGDGVFTSGGTQSNLQALFLARSRAERAADEDRAALAPRLRVLATEAAHFSVTRSARSLGLSEDAVVAVPADAAGRMDATAARETLSILEAAGELAMAIVATAGTTDRGLIDPLPEIADAARDHRAWLHVDAAYGGGLLLSRTRRHLLDGIEHADSVTVDYHKTCFQPVSSSALIVRERADLAATAHHADYLNPAAEDAEPNQVDKSLQTTRRFDALKLWTTPRSLGPDAIGDMVDACCDLAAEVRERSQRTPTCTCWAPPTSPPSSSASAPRGSTTSAPTRCATLIRRILFHSGRAMVARTTIDGTPWLKLTLLNPETTLLDVAAVLDLVRATGRGLLAGDRLAAAEETR
ncbi:pyridoxal-dependent decarboxylase [Brachybacterium sp. GPGPB12]|uniref:pyridoxal phosphate-dependent decarboxylase family protein n=1 Tax=Brachybacterium sp. GPGPB12 TaxID=3023517 RepID=UPI00313442E8